MINRFILLLSIFILIVSCAQTKSKKSVIITVNSGQVPYDHWINDLEIGGGRIIGEACHFIDLLRFIIDEPIIKSNVLEMENYDKKLTRKRSLKKNELSFSHGRSAMIWLVRNNNFKNCLATFSILYWSLLVIINPFSYDPSKNSFTTLSGKIQPINSPKIDPNIVPKKRIIIISDKDLFFISYLKSKFYLKISHLSKFLT